VFAEHDPAATAWRGECRQRFKASGVAAGEGAKSEKQLAEPVVRVHFPPAARVRCEPDF